MTSATTAPTLDRLAAAVASGPAPAPLSPARYAATHAVYEAASDQRARIQRWVVGCVPALLDHVSGRPVDVLGVGVGDGAVDRPLAEALCEGGREVRYHGIEPHAPSLDAFGDALAALRRPGLAVRGSAATLDGADPGPADVVLFVHSLYHVPDVGAALDRAVSLLRPGGAVVALTSPREPLSALADLLTPRSGRRQWFADTVGDVVADRSLPAAATTIDARLDLTALRTDPDGDGAAVLDFLLQVRADSLTGEVRTLVDAHLAAIAIDDDDDDDGDGHLVPHPVEALVAGPGAEVVLRSLRPG